MKTMAYLHPTADHCVTTAEFEFGYENSRELVLRTDANALQLMNASLQQQLKGEKAAVDLCASRMTELVDALAVMCRAALLNPHDGGASLVTYDTWCLGRSAPVRDAMKQALILVARYRGKSIFGNDWQDALA